MNNTDAPTKNLIPAAIVAIAVLSAAVAGLLVSRVLIDEDAAPSQEVFIEHVAAPDTTIARISIPVPASEVDPEPEPVRDIETEIAMFITSFSDAHTNGDLGYLLNTLHPAIYDFFGPQTCADYVEATLGSITDMASLGAGPELSFTLLNGADELTFEPSYSVAAQWTETPTDITNVVTFHVVDTDLGFFWLTTCGTTMQSA
jgi:hypothetical protein